MKFTCIYCGGSFTTSGSYLGERRAWEWHKGHFICKERFYSQDDACSELML